MFCAKCGKSLPEGIKFCGGCGEKVVPKTPSASQVVDSIAPSSSHQSYTSQQRSYRDPKQVTENLSVGDYIGMMLLMTIPFLNMIFLFIWAFSNATNINKKNFARAYLLIGVIVAALFFVIMILIGITGGGALMRSLNNSMYY
ncbi:MAG TPA: hypothetical protein GX707_05830 [Epulopiscium sp.]|nr:hypothetical protein [Candidatus Epulonipiscium sp.]